MQWLYKNGIKIDQQDEIDTLAKFQESLSTRYAYAPNKFMNFAQEIGDLLELFNHFQA